MENPLFQVGHKRDSQLKKQDRIMFLFFFEILSEYKEIPFQKVLRSIYADLQHKRRTPNL